MRSPHLPPPAVPASLGDIRRAEERLGVTLPTSLTRALQGANGFVIDDTAGSTTERWTLLPVLDSSSRRRLTMTAKDLVWYTTCARAEGDLQSDAVVIARASMPWNRLVLLPDPERPTHLAETVFRQVGMGDPVPVAPSVADLGVDPSPSRGTGGEAAAVLPHFRFHPDPVASGSVTRSRARCARCGERRGYTYASTLYARQNVPALCPWCIADGSAAGQFGASFVDEAPLAGTGVAAELIDEVCHRTPGFATFQTEVWQVCCETPGTFRGALDVDGMADLTDDELAWLGVPSWQRDLWRAMDPSRTGIAVFVFDCEHCGGRRLWADIP